MNGICFIFFTAMNNVIKASISAVTFKLKILFFPQMFYSITSPSCITSKMSLKFSAVVKYVVKKKFVANRWLNVTQMFSGTLEVIRPRTNLSIYLSETVR